MIENAQPSRRRIVFAGLVGNVMEWYDFAVYGYFAAAFGRQFFPSDRPAVSLIAAFGAFAAGFLVRPLGAWYSDGSPIWSGASAL
jgi:MHS family proline/betaine transporter-like MFS transporter